MKAVKLKTLKVLNILLICIPSLTWTQDPIFINSNLQEIISKIESLPEKYRPTDTKQAMKLMAEGKSVWDNVSSSRFYSALTLNIDDPAIVTIIKNGLQKSPDRFWTDIYNNKKVKEAIEQANVTFSFENSKKPEFFMFFRITYLKTMITQEKNLEKFESAYQQSVLALQWFLFAQAILENDNFTSAVITIPDSNMNLFYFLDGYAELISPRYRSYSAISFHSLWKSKAHTQLTRHWKHKKIFKDIAFGINFKKNEEEVTLPLNNSHLMFGALDNKLIFIKWQSDQDSIFKKPFKSIRLERKNDLHINRYDKVPQDVNLQFKSLFKHPLTRHQKNLISKDGISAMLQMLNDDNRPLFINFLQKSKNYNVFDNNIRKGNEIILNPKRFKDFYFVSIN